LFQELWLEAYAFELGGFRILIFWVLFNARDEIRSHLLDEHYTEVLTIFIYLINGITTQETYSWSALHYT